MTDIKKKTMEELEHDYKSFKLIDMYNDYGDITGIQIIRRFIQHCNKHFGKMNESIIEFIRLYTDLTEIMDEFTAFFEAWEEMVEDNENFILEIRQVLEDWIDDPRVQQWIVDRLDVMIADELPLKLDVVEFESFVDDLISQLSTLEDTIESVDDYTKDLEDRIESEVNKKADASTTDSNFDNTLIKRSSSAVSDLNTQTKTGILGTNSFTNNMPSNSPYGGVCLHIDRGSGVYVQIHVDVLSGDLMIRTKPYDQDWGSWE